MSALYDPDEPALVAPAMTPGKANGGPDPLTYAIERTSADHRRSLMSDGGERSTNRTTKGGRWIMSTATPTVPQHIPILFGPKDWDRPPVQTSIPYLPGRPVVPVEGEEGEVQP